MNEHEQVRRALEQALREAEAKANNPRFIEYYVLRMPAGGLD